MLGFNQHPALTDFFIKTADSSLSNYHPAIQDGLEKRFDQYQHGHMDQWFHIIQSLPRLPADNIDLANSVSVSQSSPLSEEQQQQLKSQLMQLHPWRKGPFHLHGLTVDCEWRSDWKWQRIRPHLNLSGKTVLDIGCGNGYHTWRMLGENAQLVVGIDPSQLFWHQFLAIKHFVGEVPVYFLPIGIEHLPNPMPVFDSVFSMGVFYHRKSPIDHLYTIRDLLKPNGEMILETLIVPGDKQTVLVPNDRYACMPNVWFIPSVDALTSWIEKAGFSHVHCIDVTQTSIEEQRATEWMTYQSLTDFLDPENPHKTIEGYPAPTRAIIIAKKY
ncbi:tRNA 5-methoxyuridine(34)/uridine 5-oxyacetic acid(34) synthase CmoB [Legionella sp. W05-934-2]|jgi:tRNA (mo5U34)-methyltransferase|uniref:tRNA 5-methoxyuridine(34)/uridine 5-oxyacetic acid(34) synthase CmoB n=1 Tax=Legionella sp. W05-934-2 TaxID=1198649 RepID=UPI003462A512